METNRIRAYTYLLYRVILDIRSASYTHRIKWWKPNTWGQMKKNMAEINDIADVFHNMPDIIVNRADEFDEEWFWRYLGSRLPDKYEYYHREFLGKLNDADTS